MTQKPLYSSKQFVVEVSPVQVYILFRRDDNIKFSVLLSIQEESNIEYICPCNSIIYKQKMHTQKRNKCTRSKPTWERSSATSFKCAIGCNESERFIYPSDSAYLLEVFSFNLVPQLNVNKQGSLVPSPALPRLCRELR